MHIQRCFWSIVVSFMGIFEENDGSPNRAKQQKNFFLICKID